MTVREPARPGAPPPASAALTGTRRDRSVLVFTALLVLAGDLASKVAASTWLRDGPVELPGPVDLQLFHNPAVTTVVAALVALGGWVGWFPSPWAVGMVVGGALGNVIDRAQAGTVIDMLHTGWWPTFNVADVAVVCGAMLLALSLARPAPE
jgi:signal peptidase II